MHKNARLVLVVLALSLFAASSRAQAPNLADTSAVAPPEMKKIGDEQYQLGSLTIDAKNRTITVPGKVNMHKGMIELMACAPGGKQHESVLVLDVVPYHLQVALILLGLKFEGGLLAQGDPHTPKGDSVTVWVSWKDGANEVSHRLEDLAWDIYRDSSMQPTDWVFSGSRMKDGRFVADIGKSLITTYHDPDSILDNPLPTGGDDETYRVNEKLVPSKGTPVTVTIKPLKPARPAESN